MEVPKAKRFKDLDILDKMRRRPCDVCGKHSHNNSPNQACHILTRGSGGPDIFENLYTGCPEHHLEQGQIGWKKMFDKYPFFRQVIYGKGFFLDGNNKLRRQTYWKNSDKFFGKL